MSTVDNNAGRAPIPFHAARAYAPAAQPRAATPRPLTTTDSGITVTPGIADRVDISAAAQRARAARAANADTVASIAPQPRKVQPPKIESLVAAKVAQRIDFTAAGNAAPVSTALPLYRHPADRNTAATEISIGRTLDLEG